MTTTTSASRKNTSARSLASAWLLLGVSACTGVIGSAGSSGSSTAGGSGPSGSGTMTGGTGTGMTGTGTGTGSGAGGGGSIGFACPANTIEPGPSPMRLLTPEQYLNTVRDLFGDIPN